MRTKKLLLAAAAIAAGLVYSQAQSNVYSVNIVGYVNKSCPSGLSIVGNPLSSSNNLASIVPAPPDFTQALQWNGFGFDTATFFFGSWDVDFNLPPGKGFFVNASSTFTNTFVGTALVGSQTNSLVSGLNLVSSIIPVAGDADSLHLTDTLSDFDQVLKYNNGSGGYDIYTFFFGSWDIGAPPFAVADGAFVSKASPGKWINTVNP